MTSKSVYMMQQIRFMTHMVFDNGKLTHLSLNYHAIQTLQRPD